MSIYKDYDKISKTLPPQTVSIPLLEECPYLLPKTIPADVCDNLIALYRTFGKDSFYDVSVNGLSNENYGKGSRRITNYDISFAEYLNSVLLKGTELEAIELDSFSKVDWGQKDDEKFSFWECLGVSPYFRYMEYTQGSEHYPHYDAPYISQDDPTVRTLFSGVLYLTTNSSGATGFLNDNQSDLPLLQRKLSDWDRQANLSEVKSWQLPKKGSIVVFPHQQCHTVFPLLEDTTRIIIRFDIFFKKV